MQPEKSPASAGRIAKKSFFMTDALGSGINQAAAK
jgi:hypothetical protein